MLVGGLSDWQGPHRNALSTMAGRRLLAAWIGGVGKPSPGTRDAVSVFIPTGVGRIAPGLTAILPDTVPAAVLEPATGSTSSPARP
jgi:hypothetical protein